MTRSRGARVRRSLATALVLATLAALALPAAAEDDRTKLARLQRERSDIAARVNATDASLRRIALERAALADRTEGLQRRLGELLTARTALEGDIARLEQRIAVAEADIALTEARIEEAGLRLAATQARASALERELAAARDLLAQHALLSYRLQLRLLPGEAWYLVAREPAEVMAHFRASLTLARSDARAIERLDAVRSLLNEQQARETHELEDLERLRRDQRVQTIALEADRAALSARAAELGQTEAERRAEDDAARAAAAERAQREAALAAEHAALRAAQEENDRAVLAHVREMTRKAELSALITGSGIPALAWPLDGPVTSWYGWRARPFPGFHNGIDIAGAMCWPVRAAAAGVVMSVGKPWPDGAHVVIIAHTRDASTVYAHLADAAPCPVPVRVGQMVTTGDVIGYVGMTGVTTGPHLHFSVITGDKWVDPAPHLP